MHALLIHAHAANLSFLVVPTAGPLVRPAAAHPPPLPSPLLPGVSQPGTRSMALFLCTVPRFISFLPVLPIPLILRSPIMSSPHAVLGWVASVSIMVHVRYVPKAKTHRQRDTEAALHPAHTGAHSQTHCNFTNRWKGRGGRQFCVDSRREWHSARSPTSQESVS